MNAINIREFYPVIIVGGGQAGLSMSFHLQKLNIDHLVIEAREVMNAWKERRWDSFTLVTPNWQCALPGHSYDGDDPRGFMKRDEIVEYLNRFAQKVAAPVLTHTSVTLVRQADDDHFTVETTTGTFRARQVVVAAGNYQEPVIPRLAERLPRQIVQLHSEQYANPRSLPEGAILVVGSGQSGAQIAEDLHLAGRKVHLATGDAPRVARFYRGRDVVAWLHDMKYYDIPVDKHPLREGVRDNTNHYVTGRDGGRDIDLRKFALEGMELYGRLVDFDGDNFQFAPNLRENLDNADSTYNSICQRIDDYIEVNNINAPPSKHYNAVWQPPLERTELSLNESGITAILWCIGFKPNYDWLDVPVFNGRGYPQFHRGVTQVPGLYFIGLPWLHTWGSGRFASVGRDAHYLCEFIRAFETDNEKSIKVACH